MQANTLSDSRKLFDYIVTTGLEFDRQITKVELTNVLGVPFEKRRSAIYPAIRQLEKSHQRTLITLPRVGYRIARANESESIAHVRVQRSRRQITRGQHTLTHTDMAHLTPEERRRIETLQSGLAAVQQELRRVQRRLDVAEGRIEALEEAPALTPKEVEFLRGLMQR